MPGFWEPPGHVPGRRDAQPSTVHPSHYQLLPAPARRVRVQLEPGTGWSKPDCAGDSPGDSSCCPCPQPGHHSRAVRLCPAMPEEPHPHPMSFPPPTDFTRPECHGHGATGAGTAPALKVTPGHSIPPWGPHAGQVPVRTPGRTKGAGVHTSPDAPHMPGCCGREQMAPGTGGIKLDKLPLFPAEPLRVIRVQLRRAA